MHIWGRYSFLLNEIQTASLFKNCVGVIKDKSWAIIPFPEGDNTFPHYSAITLEIIKLLTGIEVTKKSFVTVRFIAEVELVENYCITGYKKKNSKN